MNPEIPQQRGGETVYLVEPGILVTSARFATKEQTIPIRSISVIGSKIIPAPKGGAYLAIIIGFLLLPLFGLGLILVVIGLFSLRRAKVKNSICVTTAGGEQSLLIEGNEDFARRVLDSLNLAVIQNHS